MPTPPRYPISVNVSTIEHGWCCTCDWTVTGHRTRPNSWTHANRHGHRVRTAQTVVAEYMPNLPISVGRDLTQPVEHRAQGPQLDGATS